jgi:hypothetical protein
MADFQETAREKIKQLSAKRAETRRDAAYYLGEAGHDEAITRLAWLYKNDPDKSVRQAAKYALGQFRAVELALKRGDEEKVVGLLEGIVNDGKMGRRLTTRPAQLGVFAFILLLVFVGLVAAALLIPGKRPLPGPLASLKLSGPVIQAPSGPTNVTLDQIQPAYTAIQADAQTLTTQLQGVLTGGKLDCSAFLNGTSPIVFSGDTTGKPELAAAIQTINDAQAAVSAASMRYHEACFENKPLKPEELGGLLAPLIGAGRDLPLAQQVIATQEAIAQMSPTPSPEPSITPAMTQAVVATEAPTATTALNGANLVPLYDLVSTMTDPRGPNRLLMQYWQDGKAANRTDGCNLTQPTIPDDYTLPDGTVPSEQLSQAVALVNTGLQGVRQNWAEFQTACAAHTLSQAAALGLQKATAANDAFNTAAIALDNVRKGQ